MHNFCAFPYISPDLLLSFVISFKTRLYKPASTKMWYIQQNALNWIGGSTYQYVHEGIKKRLLQLKGSYKPPIILLEFYFLRKKTGLFYFYFFFFLHRTEYLTFMSAVLCVTSYRLRKNGKFRLRPKGRWIFEEERLEISSTPVILS